MGLRHGRARVLTDASLRGLELGLVALTAAVFVALPKPPAAVAPMAVFIPLCIGGWVAFLLFRVRGDPSLVDRWGLRPGRDLGPLCARLGPLLVLAVIANAAIAHARGQLEIPELLWLSLLLYPLWGLVQQWLVQALFVDNVRALTGARLPWLLAAGGVGFGAIHLAHPLLVVGTALMGVVYVALFQRWRNLWPLAVCHGWLGSLFYPWVLGLNPTADLVAQLRAWIG